MAEEFRRPNPDELLARVQADEKRAARGRLKIFMGYAAGVGKTYAMLEAAHQRLTEGVDTVVGYIETHKRKETEAMLAGLNVLPRKSFEYRGTQLTELDVDAVLACHPQLVLVDELAHTNAPGSRHAKRYMDVEDLLEQGIHVYTTLNIQHLESLNDIVHQITGVRMHETIPDGIVDQADEIELIDLPPDELLHRLEDGKVYVPEQASRAVHEFFRKGNLTALREISLRRAADQVDEQMLDYMETKAIPGPWPANERILVAVSSHPLSERLIRSGKRLADNLNADWYAVYIETPERLHYSPLHAERVQHNLQLAEELGAKVMTITGRTVPEAVLEFAHKYNITKIIAGKPLRPRWLESLRGSIVDEIIRNSGPIDIYVMSDKSGPLPAAQANAPRPHRPWRRYVFSILLVAAGTLFSFLIQPVLHPVNLVMVYIVAVLIAALYLGRGPSILASFLGVVTYDFFFVDPKFTFSVADTQYLLTFIVLLVVGLTISNLTATVRDQLEALQRRQAQTSTLYSLSRDLTTAIGLEAINQIIIEHIGEAFSREAVILLPDRDRIKPAAASAGFTLDENEQAVALWAYQHGHPAGRGTDTLPAARVRYMPLKTTHGTVGVLGAMPLNVNEAMTPEQRQFLDAYANLAALAIERVQLDEQASRAQVLQATEQLQTALLNSISHDLRTPLASITGVLESLIEADQVGQTGMILSLTDRRDLEENAREQAHRLNRLVGNLLDMTRLEAGALQLRLEESDIQDVIGAALAHLKDPLQNHPIQTDVPDGLPLFRGDFVLIEQVLINLLDNAAKFSPPGAPIEVAARGTDSQIEVTVADRGIGIPPEDLTRIFDKFYRVQRSENGVGTGLGLSICKGMVEAHGGRIWAENRQGGGTSLLLSLPITCCEEIGSNPY